MTSGSESFILLICTYRCRQVTFCHDDIGGRCSRRGGTTGFALKQSVVNYMTEREIDMVSATGIGCHESNSHKLKFFLLLADQ